MPPPSNFELASMTSNLASPCMESRMEPRLRSARLHLSTRLALLISAPPTQFDLQVFNTTGVLLLYRILVNAHLISEVHTEFEHEKTKLFKKHKQDKVQCCYAGSRTFVHEKIYDDFVEKSKARALELVVADPFKKGVEQGPQIDDEQFNKILCYIKLGVEGGASLVIGGDRIGNKGYYIQPTIFSDVKDDMVIAKDEIFGPVQSILKFKTLGTPLSNAN